LIDVIGQLQRPAALPSVLTEWETGWAPETVRTVLEKRKYLTQSGLELRTVHPAGSRCNYYVIPTPIYTLSIN